MGGLRFALLIIRLFFSPCKNILIFMMAVNRCTVLGPLEIDEKGNVNVVS
jgi:hypothetical protein